MKLSSLDIRKQQFSRIVRGYDRDEVDAFLDMVGTQWQELIDDSRRSEEKITEMQVKLEHYQKVEEALEEAIKTARDNAEKKIKDAEKSANAVLEKAEARAVKITIGAEEERLKIKRETARYSIRQKEMLTKFRSFLTSELEMLAYHEKNDSMRMPELESIDMDDTSAPADVPAADEANNSDSIPTEASPRNSEEAADTAENTIQTDEEAPPAQQSTDSNESIEHIDDSSADTAESTAADEPSIEEADVDEDQKGAWTVNTLVSPDADGEESNDSTSPSPDRAASPPKGDMRAAQEEIENLRKLLKDLE